MEIIEQKKAPISEAEWLTHYKSWQKTSLNKTEYCRQHNLVIDNFYSWCYRFKKKEKRDAHYESNVFIPIVSKEVSQASSRLMVATPIPVLWI